MINAAAAAAGQFIVDHAFSYLKHQRLELLMRYECSDAIIIPKTVFILMDEPKFVELSAVRLGAPGGNNGSRLGTASILARASAGVEFKNSLIAKHWNM